MAYTTILSKLGLAKNEAKIYETLLGEEDLSVGDISKKSNIHRRNVYDSLNRLIEKGLVFEILESKENRYKAVDPNKLEEIIDEKKQALDKIMPNLIELYKGKPHPNEVCIYKGVEGWKNYMRDILRLGEDVYIVGGKGSWVTKKLKSFSEQFERDASKKGIKFYILYENEVKVFDHEIKKHFGNAYRYTPAGFSTACALDIFADRVVIHSKIGASGEISDQTSFAVIINQQIADAFRIWHKFIWDNCKPAG